VISQSTPAPITEESAVDTIWNLAETQDRNDLVIKKSNNERKLSIIVFEKPSESNDHRYWIKVVEDNGVNYVSHFNFFVYPVTNEIKYYDTETNKELELEKWRNKK
jgi:hypothetical protein